MRHRWILLLLACLCAATACRPAGPAAAADAAAPAGAERPADAVRLLTRHLRANALDAYARDAVPPALHAQLEAAWRDGRTRWPLDELPLGERVPAMLDALAAPDAETRYRALFDRQFAHSARELESTAAALGLFGVQYVRNEGDFSAGEREHYSQIIAAVSRWAQTAPLADPTRAHAAIPRLAAAARATGLRSEADFARAGMQDGLRRIAPFAAAARQALAAYGLDLDAALASAEATLQSQTGDTARVRLRYELAGEPIDTVVQVERREGRWYLSDVLRHARAALRRPAPPAAAGAMGAPAPRAAGARPPSA